jgi:Skp family chaperone for outer membrane proteins
MKQDMEDELRKRDNELTSKILRDVLDIVKKVGDERGYSLVMQLSPQIVYANKSDDITDEVLKRYDSGR